MRKRKQPTQEELKKQMERDERDLKSMIIRQLYSDNLERRTPYRMARAV